MTAPAGGRTFRRAVLVDGTPFLVELEELPDGRLRVQVDGDALDVDARLPADATGSLLVDGASYLVDVHLEPGDPQVLVGGEAFRVQLADPSRPPGAGGARPDDGAGQRVVAPMPGKVVAVLVTVGQRVEPGAGLVVLEAMKMENEFRAAAGGVVAEILVAPGQAVNTGDVLVVVA